MRTYIGLFLVSIFLYACQMEQEQLPILGEKLIEGTDTLYHTIPEFSFINQEGQEVTLATFEDKIYVVDFFFVSCPTICPVVKAQMLRVLEAYQDEDRLVFLSHTIDPKRDTVERLKKYADNLGVGAPKWHFVTGDKEKLHGIASSYFSIAYEDATAPGGFDHSGRLILIDQNKRIRSYCDGTDPKSVDQFIKDIGILLEKG
ncbi:MAG: SCO family protein [Saprospiraceae bacterium]|jgi:protein SCO1/2